MQIRDATREDLRFVASSICRIQDAHVDAYPHVYRPICIEDAVEHVSLRLVAPDCFIRVAECDDDVAGFTISEIHDIPQCFFKLRQRYLHVSQIEVHPDRRRSGVGAALVADLDAIAERNTLDRIELNVSDFNSTASRFFASHGFRRFGTRLVRTPSTKRWPADTKPPNGFVILSKIHYDEPGIQ